MVQREILDFFAFIDHAPEDDELKAHRHVYFVPSSQMQTYSLKKYLEEFDEKMPDKPLGVTIFTSSKFDDWYMYGCHDKAYLAAKGQKRKHTYVKSQFVVSSQEHFDELVRCVDRSKFVGIERVVDAAENGLAFNEMVRLGQVPIQLISQYKYAYDILKGVDVQRNGRETHTPKAKPTEDIPFLVDDYGEIVPNPFFKQSAGDND